MTCTDPGGGQGLQNPLENYNLLYVSLEILVRSTREASGPLGSYCFSREVLVADPQGVQGVRSNPRPAPVF